MNNFSIKRAQSKDEIQAAQRLRFQVFNLEMNRGLANASADQLDQDAFDAFCDHLIIIDNSTQNIVGTYRLLLDAKAQDNIGYYSETKFNIDPLKKLSGRMLEVGRSCVHKDFRNRTVLNLLWQGIADYANKHNVRYIFGLSNIMTNDPVKISQFYKMFIMLGLYNDLNITSRSSGEQINVDKNVPLADPQALFHKLPTLFKGYMKIGLKVCGLPVQGDFGTAIFPVLLDINHMNSLYKAHFFGSRFDCTPPVVLKTEYAAS